MKKRVNSNNLLQKVQKPALEVYQLEAIRQKKLQSHKHHNHCVVPKADKKQGSKRKKGSQSLQGIKQLKTPILNDVRRLATNLINSCDKIVHHFKDESIKHSLQKYGDDRTKLIQYLNSLIVKPISLAQMMVRAEKHHLNEPIHSQKIIGKQVEDYLVSEVGQIKANIDKAILRKRCNSSSALHSNLQKQVSLVKNKIEQLQKKNDQSSECNLNSFIKLCKKLNGLNKNNNPTNNPQSSELLGGQVEILRSQIAQQSNKNDQLVKKSLDQAKQIESIKGNMVYIELLIFKCSQLAQENLSYSMENGQFYVIQKAKMNMLVNILRQAGQRISSQPGTTLDIMLKLKEQAQNMILHLGQLRRKSFQLLREKEKAMETLSIQRQIKQNEELYLQELKQKVRRLNDEMGEMIQQIDKKEELVDYLKIENQNLKQDIKNMQELIKNTKQNYKILGDELEDLNQKFKNLETESQMKDDHILELMNQLKMKNLQIGEKLQQLQSRQEDILQLRQQYMRLDESRLKTINSLNEQKKLLGLERQQKQNELKQVQNKFKFLQQQSLILQKKIENVFNSEQQHRFSIETLQEKIRSLEVQNQQLYKDLRNYQNDHQSHQQAAEQYTEAYKQLQLQCDNLRQQLANEHKKVRFYQQKILQLAKLADTSYYETIIENHQKVIAELTKKIQKYERSQVIIQQNSQEIDQTELPSEIDEQKEKFIINIHQQVQKKKLDQQNIQEHLQYEPFLMQETPQDKSRKSSFQEGQFLNVSKSSVPNNSVISALSHYNIFIVNQNLDTIDQHKAVYPKTAKKQVLAISEPLSIPIQNQFPEKLLSNIADASDSQSMAYPSQQNQFGKLNEDYIQNLDLNDDQSLSGASKNVHADQQNKKYKTTDFNDDFTDSLPEINTIKQIPDIIMTDRTTQSKKKEMLFKNVNSEQQKLADLRFSGQKRSPSQISPKTIRKPQRKISIDRQSSKQKGTVYIRIKKSNIQTISSQRGRPRSCYHQD